MKKQALALDILGKASHAQARKPASSACSFVLRSLRPALWDNFLLLVVDFFSQAVVWL